MAFSPLSILLIIAVVQQSFSTFITYSNPCQPITVSNGNVKLTQTNGIQKFSFNCGNGFTPIGKTISVCSNGQWSNPNPSCIDQTSVKSIENGYLTVTADGKYVVECNPGFTLVGNKEITHQTTWPTCVPAEPSKVTSQVYLENGVYEMSDNGYTYTFKCNDGFTLHGQQQIRYINNQWTGPVPVCLALQTVPSTQVLNANVATQSIPTTFSVVNTQQSIPTTYSVVNTQQNIPTTYSIVNTHQNIPTTYSIVNTHQNIPTTYSVVNTQQTMPTTYTTFHTNVAAQNIPTAVVNTQPQVATPFKVTNIMKTIPNGQGTMNQDGTITFTCNAGFSMAGDAVVQNQPEAQVPVCIPNGDATIENGRVEVVIVSTGYELLYKCNDQFQLVGDERIMTATGQQIVNRPTCVAVCPTRFIKNGWVESNNQSNIAHYGCCDGFEIQGATESTCVNGQWVNPLPVCIPLCKPINLMNGQAQYNKDSTTFACNAGYLLVGASETTCNNGQWMSETPICVPQCPAPQFENGIYEPILNTQKFKFTCNPGFELVGTSEIACNFGQWSHPAPVCTAACQQLHINNGIAIASRDFKVVRVQCNSGYVLNGVQEINCNSGRWNAPVPTCEPLCEAVVTLNIKVSVEDLIKYNCNTQQIAYVQ